MKKLEQLAKEYNDISQKIQNPEKLNPGELASLTSRHAQLTPVMNLCAEIKKLEEAVQEYEHAIGEEDPELAAIVRDELPQIEKKLAQKQEELKKSLLSKNPHAEKDVVMEIRAGAGGDEASLFAADLFKMYSRCAENNNWKVHLISESRSEVGGYKEVIFSIKGSKVYEKMRFESGVHRIQRIPETEKSGRVHTSTATVAVLPQATPVEISIKPEELRIDTFRASGHGGQKVQKTESAVRITHVPTGIIVQCQDERSQQQNKERSMEVLRSRLLAKQLEEQQKDMRTTRKSQIGTGDRSEKIRTYNMPQDRITDHRLKKSWHNAEDIMNGNLKPVTDALIERAEQESLRELEE